MSRPFVWWSYMHYVFEDLYYLAGIFGLLVVGINIKTFLKAKEDEKIKNSNKEQKLSVKFSKLFEEWKVERKSFLETIDKTDVSWIRTDKYQEILEAQKSHDEKYFIKISDGTDITNELNKITSILKEFEEFSRQFLLFKQFEGVIEKKDFLEMYSNLYSFKKDMKTENADKLFKEFSKLYTKEIQKLAK